MARQCNAITLRRDLPLRFINFKGKAPDDDLSQTSHPAPLQFHQPFTICLQKKLIPSQELYGP
ncbi:hypothetical protein SLEP1_g19901 [Rubroshorea leprosula]|uniref:Uncharacterized protein n=1 Tax=Rubroshorea leprosula TaxID=152421 RepID=A0AAV5JA19_9ROSI|nr:hypothetical protein SLEP1_g19901 [Rubroshorea leprosula]